MKGMSLLLMLVLLLVLLQLILSKGKGKTIIPTRSSINKKNKGWMNNAFTKGLYIRIIITTIKIIMMLGLFREVKTFFCSELEALTLALTKPNDLAIPSKSLDELVKCLNLEADKPAFTVSVMVKFSRKLFEPNINTKLKSLMSIHILMQSCEEKTQQILKQCISALKQESDAKYGKNFFAVEAIDDIESSSKAEFEKIEYLKEYAAYVFDFIAAKGEKYSESKARGGDDRAEMLLDLVEQGQVVDSYCKKMKTSLFKQCLGIHSNNNYYNYNNNNYYAYYSH